MMVALMILYVTSIKADVAVLQSQQEASEKKFDQIDEKLDQLITLAISDGRS
jgi:chaperonin cofactor prefoldin